MPEKRLLDSGTRKNCAIRHALPASIRIAYVKNHLYPHTKDSKVLESYSCVRKDGRMRVKDDARQEKGVGCQDHTQIWNAHGNTRCERRMGA